MRLNTLGLALLLCGAGAWAQGVAETPASPPAPAKRTVARKAPKTATAARAAQKAPKAAEAVAKTAAQERTAALRAHYLATRSALRAKDRFETLETLLGGPAGRWWIRPELAVRLGLTAEQQEKMDDVFQQHRIELIDRNAAVQKEEAIMEPLVSADQPDESKILSQIDKLARARAELEQANARMLLGIRRVLTPEQWKTLKSLPLPPQK